MDQSLPRPTHSPPFRMVILLGVIVAAWFALYNLIQPLANWITYSLLHLQTGSHLGESVAFFLYDVPKILLLLSGMIFLISILRTFFSPERTRALLGGKRQGIGNVLAALLGIVTPFCSCSAVPLFIGFVESGIPLGVTFSFLIAAPTINEVAIVMLFGLFGWKVAALYITSGLIIAILAGMVIGRLNLERYVEDFVWKMQSAGIVEGEKLTWSIRIQRAWMWWWGLLLELASTASCQNQPWQASWASRPGGRYPLRCSWESRSTPMRPV
jgi:uncharacterized membrane protein YraQ (UPF0718 family)